MKTDINDRTDIERLIKSFYDHVQKDEVIGFIFNDIAKVNWDKHLPVMYDFWENILFQTNKYAGNPMSIHMALNERVPLLKEHFQRWIQLFTQTVDELFEGKNAGLAKAKAQSIAGIMEAKITSPFKFVP